jgi:RHS repeat-associated protein
LGDITYDSFGKIVAASVTPAGARSLFGYAGSVYDSATGLDYMNARYYDPNTGRFLSEDPTGFAAGDANLYRYVGNNPVNAIDPTGLNMNFLGGLSNSISSFASQYAPSMPSFNFYNGFTLSPGALGTSPIGASSVPIPSAFSNSYQLPTNSWATDDLGGKNGASVLGGLLGENNPNYIMDTNFHDIVLPRALGVVRAIGGAAETVTGAGLATASAPLVGTGVGTPFGLAGLAGGSIVIGHGLDVFWAGLQQAWSGDYQRTNFSQQLDRVTGNPVYSEIGDAGLSIGGAASAAFAASRIGSFSAPSGALLESERIVAGVGPEGNPFYSQFDTGLPFAGPIGPSASTSLRPGSVSGNPANRLVETGTPLKNGTGWVKRWTTMTAEEEQAQAQAVSDRYNQVEIQSRSLPPDEQGPYRFEQMRQFRTNYRQQFLENKEH